jgi:hypothetical protein
MSGIKGMYQSEESKKKKSIAMQNKWNDPEYRKKMVEKQIKLGLR